MLPIRDAAGRRPQPDATLIAFLSQVPFFRDKYSLLGLLTTENPPILMSPFLDSFASRLYYCLGAARLTGMLLYPGSLEMQPPVVWATSLKGPAGFIVIHNPCSKVAVENRFLRSA